jgi:Tfp pilus assembly protein PilV
MVGFLPFGPEMLSEMKMYSVVQPVGYKAPRTRIGGRGGFTLMEVIISILMLSIGVAALIGSMVFSLGSVMQSSHEVAVLNIARQKLENLMNITYGSLSTTAGQYDESNVVIDATQGITADVSAAVVSGGTNKKKITVTVTWDENGRTHETTLFSLASNHNIIN